MKKIALLGGMFMMALASIGCVAGVDEGGENVGSNKEGIGQGSSVVEKPGGDANVTASGDANTPTSDAAFAGPYWVYGQPFTGDFGELPEGCEIDENVIRVDDYGGDATITVIALTSTAYEVPDGVFPWKHELRYALGQLMEQNWATYASGIATCIDGSTVQLQEFPSWYLVNYNP